MRGKRAILTFQDADTFTRDDLGRRVRTAGVGTSVPGAVAPPSATDTEPSGEVIDLVAHLAVWNMPTLTTESWVQVEGTGALGLDGDFGIVRASGGRRIVRLALIRKERRDGSHGRV